MANRFWIAEYADIAETVRGSAQAPKDPPVFEQPVLTIGGTAVQSAAFSATTRFILITNDTACSILIGGTNPVATTANHRMPSEQVYFRGVTPGDKLSVIANP